MSAFIAARRVLSPGFFERQPARLPQPFTPKKPYRHRSVLTKQRTRLTKLCTRIWRKTPLFFFEDHQEKIAENL